MNTVKLKEMNLLIEKNNKGGSAWNFETLKHSFM